ncbi:MAG TPA: hypothetical protein VEA78_13410 [Acidimicrobiales bacterium]|nr:hypothetical protein [Acidimicrobiales bacterium]
MREWVSLETAPRAGHGSYPCQGLYWTPDDGSRPTTAFIATHYNVDFSEHYLASHLAERGFGFLGWNTRYRGNEQYFVLDSAVTDIGAGVRWLRDVAGVERVVILGNSGGGSLMGAYQSLSSGDQRADLYVSLQAHLGRPEVFTAWLDPAVVDETDPFTVDAALDMFDAANGPPYSPEFLERYRAAQVARNDRITAWAKAELERHPQDRLFFVHRVWADPRFLDLTLDPSDRIVGCYAGDARRANESPFGLGRVNTCRTWLSMWSLSESGCSCAPHLPKITEPSLLVQSTGDTGIFPSDARAMFDLMGADDKTIEWVDGDHYFQHSGSRDEVADLIASWVRERNG